MFAIADPCAQASGWGPRLSWTMDVVKTVISVVLAALAAVYFVNRSQRLHTARLDRHKMELQFKVECLQEFRRAAYQYESAAMNAYTDLYRWTTGDKTEAMRRYTDEAHGNFEAALDEVRDRFQGDNDVALMLEELEKSNVKRHKAYDYVFDFLLDHEKVSSWEFTAKHRKGFDDALADFQMFRQSLTSAMRSHITKFAGRTP